MRLHLIIPALAILALSACERDEPRLLNLRKADRTPDEFSILPTKPLQTPESFSALPPPTPGGTNLVDPVPDADAAVALGGRPNGGTGIDGALAASVGRYGVTPNIRGVLAAEDLAFRRANDGLLLERLFNVNVYFDAYEVQALDQYGELARLRRLGVRTVAAPPEGIE